MVTSRPLALAQLRLDVSGPSIYIYTCMEVPISTELYHIKSIEEEGEIHSEITTGKYKNFSRHASA
jgi:hypothetical protein